MIFGLFFLGACLTENKLFFPQEKKRNERNLLKQKVFLKSILLVDFKTHMIFLEILI